MESLKYFAYGSNLDQEQMKERCPDSQALIAVKLEDYKLLYRRGVATIEKSPGDLVYGAIYAISERDLANLDRYEGYPDYYQRQTYQLKRLDNGEFIEAIGYYMEAEKFEKSPPSEDYYQIIERGYRDWELPVEHLQENLSSFRNSME
ncbi:gamma-glutamylcyclotransferase family protein [Fuchsiella alkaliacetigena]|uniref:gamma-glutamylcyclotransferase family protein n=1 Tax=Fuchsiella alkaliacetigena TaxID=957042 RepID=UPI002009E6D7|nr:gamma-glutamylcyclotransferase family protein [Fuchsiella alkaliacetigena]MCK8825909.1 gamma-glutamylcyclotransferase [Fuchsiella alkaliacetigena]